MMPVNKYINSISDKFSKETMNQNYTIVNNYNKIEDVFSIIIVRCYTYGPRKICAVKTWF